MPSAGAMSPPAAFRVRSSAVGQRWAYVPSVVVAFRLAERSLHRHDVAARCDQPDERAGDVAGRSHPAGGPPTPTVGSTAPPRAASPVRTGCRTAQLAVRVNVSAVSGTTPKVQWSVDGQTCYDGDPADSMTVITATAQKAKTFQRRAVPADHVGDHRRLSPDPRPLTP